MRYAWPADRKGNHKMIDCYRPVKTDPGTANIPKANEYQKLRVGACEMEEDRKDLYTERSDREEHKDTASGSESSESSDNSESSDGSTESSDRIANWSSE